MIQKQALTLVRPSLWEDPYELIPFENFLVQELLKEDENGSANRNVIWAALLYAIKNKTYAQCWTSLPESDALWRIYDKKGTGIRIKIKTENVSLLTDEITLSKVQYYNDVSKIDFRKFGQDKFDQVFALKRRAFAHEKEVRLLSRYRLPNDSDEAEKYVQAFLLLMGHEGFRESYIKNNRCSSEEISINLDRLLRGTGYKDFPEKKDIAFSHIENFIDSVMLSPFASEWLVETVETFC